MAFYSSDKMAFNIYVNTGRRAETIKNVYSSTTINDVKMFYDDLTGDGSNCTFVYNGRSLSGTDTLGSIGVFGGATLQAVSRCYGGGGIPGPNLNNKLIEKEWSNNAPAYRKHALGLNIEFKYNGKKVIGQIGYTTNKKNKFPKGVFEAHRGKHIKMAYCPSEKVSCPSHDSIVKYWFNKCRVVFDGELTSGQEIYQTKTFGNKAFCFEGDPARYANLTMTVSPN